MKSKANQIYFKKNKNNPRYDVHTLPKQLIVERLYIWLQFGGGGGGGGVVCFHPLAFVVQLHTSHVTWLFLL
jgi:hypothetical protein